MQDDSRLRLAHSFSVKYEEVFSSDSFVRPIVVRDKPEGHPFAGQQRLEVLGFSVLKQISSEDCFAVLGTYGDLALCPGNKLWVLVKKHLPSQKWCILFDERNCIWRIDSKKNDLPEAAAKLHYRRGSATDHPFLPGNFVSAAYYKLHKSIL